MSAEERRVPVHALGLSPSEFGHYDETGTVREQVYKMSAAAVGQCVEQIGFSGDEQDAAIKEMRRVLRHQATRRRREKATENS